ncbi:hypothetical protein [Roseofilum capinflatum]|uniref:Uncharacterized protein n=1 Tax=Roseofilum capinflatum BLCC-M114 TaxID=3022440 RepID=A0ABT7B9W5_9CYAN|nr:hypothetical protein [Roseofilum capinflatum]MDJ1175964.1 hypothetical protein [Roseofilum capinflatum BLCC-M114]
MSISNPKKECKRKFCITVGIILLIEIPQVVAAWVTLADKITLFPTPSIQVVETNYPRLK